MSEWREIKLQSCTEILSSKRIFMSDYVPTGIPFYRSKEVIQKALGEYVETEHFISKNKFEEIAQKYGSPENGDILISAVGARYGIPYLVNNENDFYFKDGNLIWFRYFNKGLESAYLFYYLKSSVGQFQLKSIAIGSAQPALTIDGLKNLYISIPPLPEQKAIASVLSFLDSKIDLLRRQNQTIENIAQDLFKRWFIDFEFPDKDGKPYKSGGGKMVGSELGEIPEGWRVVLLPEYVSFEKGIEPGSKNYFETAENDFIKFLRVGDLGSRGGNSIYIRKELAYGKVVNNKDILITMDATIGIVKIGLEGAYSSGIRKVYPKNKNIISNPFIYCLLKTPYIQNIIKAYADGTTILHAGNSINHMSIPLPNKEIMDKFSSVINHIFSKMLINIENAQTLTKTRDTLLPKLMSGQIRVKSL